MEHKIKSLKYFLISALFLPGLAFADTIITDPKGSPVQDPKAVVDFIDRLKNIVLGIAGMIALAMIFYGAFLMMSASGDPEKLKKAKQTLTWAFIGLALIIASYAIVALVTRVLGGGVA